MKAGAVRTGESRSAPLIDFRDKRHRLLLLAIGMVLVCGVSLKTHGYSITVWHRIIDQSPEDEVVFGKSRAIRSDDYILDIPMMLAQSSHTPRFPVVNNNIGTGQIMSLPHELPVRGIAAIYRPFVWGFVVGPDAGLSFRWWSLVLGLFYTAFLALMIVSRNHFLGSVLLSLGLVFSPYFQAWSFHKAEIVVYGFLAFIAICHFLAAKRPRGILLAAALAGYSVTGIALSHVYPAISVPVGWFVLFGATAFFLDRREDLQLGGALGARLAGIGLALIIVAFSAAAFYRESGEAIRLLRETIYPGHRFSSGGGFPLWAFFSHNLGAGLSDADEPWIQNACESATFVFGFAPLALAGILSLFSRARLKNPFLWLMTFYILFLGVFTYIGFPAWLSRLTFFGITTPNRTQIGFGLANAFILSAAFSPRFGLQDTERGTITLALIAFSAVLIVSMFWFKLDHTPLSYGIAVPLLVANLAAAAYSLRTGKMLVLTAFVTAVSFFLSVRLNPVVIGGSEYLFHNELSANLSTISRNDTQRSPWIVLGDWRMSNLPRILGIPSLGGYHNYPHFKIWREIDPEGKWSSVYNQSGFVTFMASPEQEPVFRQVFAADFEVYVNPGFDGLKKLGVRYILSCSDTYRPLFRSQRDFREIYRFRNFTVYERQETDIR